MCTCNKLLGTMYLRICIICFFKMLRTFSNLFFKLARKLLYKMTKIQEIRLKCSIIIDKSKHFPAHQVDFINFSITV